ncbi:hypothetical protein [Actinoallomurus sp. CA-142502]|uniref:hypothetical protein n=1 Tax=Actinoallomurus sp. CA-142502 TaxID=3239885 RepID=UPI003D8C2144
MAVSSGRRSEEATVTEARVQIRSGRDPGATSGLQQGTPPERGLPPGTARTGVLPATEPADFADTTTTAGIGPAVTRTVTRACLTGAIGNSTTPAVSLRVATDRRPTDRRTPFRHRTASGRGATTTSRTTAARSLAADGRHLPHPTRPRRVLRPATSRTAPARRLAAGRQGRLPHRV